MNSSTSMIWKWLVLAILATLSVYVVIAPPGRKEQAASETGEQTWLQRNLPGIRLGIDLAGGTSFIVAIDEAQLRVQIEDENRDAAGNVALTPAQIDAEVNKRMSGASDRVLEILRKRVDNMGVNEPIMFRSQQHITIQLPGATAKQRQAAERQIESAAFLEFRLVHKDNATLVSNLLDKKGAPEGFIKSDSGTGYIPTAEFNTLRGDPEYRRRLSLFGRDTAQLTTYSMLLHETPARPGQPRVFTPVFVSNTRELTGEDLSSASVDQDSTTGQIAVNLKLNSQGAQKFRKVTGKNVGRQLAIVLDGVIYSYPTIQTEIAGGSAQITGGFSATEANELRNVLNAGALPTPIKIVEKRVIDPTLGGDAIKSGLYAAIGGGILIFIFMFLYYFYLGFLANVALALDLLLLPAAMIIAAGCLSFFDSSVDTRGGFSLPVFTMPGIAGIVLTIGFAVDANILIFERIREEFKLGKSARAAVAAGYDRAFITILDANLTSLITAVILFIFGTGPIKGFAITLTAGLLVSMFTVLIITRMIFDLTVPEGRVKPYKMLEIFKNLPNINFLGYAKPALVGTAIFIIATLALFGIRVASSPDSVLSVELTGGQSIEFAYANQVPTADIRGALGNAGIRADIQYQNTFAGSGIMQVRTSRTSADTSANETLQLIQTTLNDAFPDAQFKYQSSDTISSSIGKEMKKSAFWSITLALLGMVIYIALRFEFGFALGTLAALAADVFVCVGLFALLGRQLNLIAIAALLTVVGYAINDSIVIFDRIREDLAKYPREDFKTLINQACNRTLSRTVLTSVTTLFPVGALIIFGSGAIFDFALIMGIGIIFGTFATLFIATPVMVAWYRGRRPNFAQKKSA